MSGGKSSETFLFLFAAIYFCFGVIHLLKQPMRTKELNFLETVLTLVLQIGIYIYTAFTSWFSLCLTSVSISPNPHTLVLFFSVIEINAALILETLRPADYPQSASLKHIRKALSNVLFYASCGGGAVLCFGYWYNNTRRKDDGRAHTYGLYVIRLSNNTYIYIHVYIYTT